MMPGLPMEPSKTHGQENFPVASVLIAPKHRATILAYYRFARTSNSIKAVADLLSVLSQALSRKPWFSGAGKKNSASARETESCSSC
jgi:hypothetical protein